MLQASALTPVLTEGFFCAFYSDGSLEQVAKSCLIGTCLLKPGACCDWK